MGDISEYYQDQYFEQEKAVRDEFSRIAEENAILDTIWTTKDGQKLKLREMDEDHLRNATRMMIRKLREINEEENAAYSMGSVFQGEQAQIDVNRAALQLSQLADETKDTVTLLMSACDLRKINYK